MHGRQHGRQTDRQVLEKHTGSLITAPTPLSSGHCVRMGGTRSDAWSRLPYCQHPAASVVVCPLCLGHLWPTNMLSLPPDPHPVANRTSNRAAPLRVGRADSYSRGPPLPAVRFQTPNMLPYLAHYCPIVLSPCGWQAGPHSRHLPTSVPKLGNPANVFRGCLSIRPDSPTMVAANTMQSPCQVGPKWSLRLVAHYALAWARSIGMPFACRDPDCRNVTKVSGNVTNRVT